MKLEIPPESETELKPISKTQTLNNEITDIEGQLPDEYPTKEPLNYFKINYVGNLIVFYYYKGLPCFMLGPDCNFIN